LKFLLKHFYLLIILIILFTIGSAKLYYNKGSSSTALKEAFIASGATLANTEFYAWAKTEKSFEELSKSWTTLRKI